MNTSEQLTIREVLERDANTLAGIDARRQAENCPGIGRGLEGLILDRHCRELEIEANHE